MEIEEVDSLIAYHQAGLDQYRQHISPSAQVLEEKTIEALQELKDKMERIQSGRVKEAERILRERNK